MTEQDYAEIVTACDRLLRAPGTSLARVAIPLLHVANEHPSTLNTFRQVFRSDTAADPADLGGTSELPSGQGSPMRMAARAVRAVWRSAVLESGAGKIWQHAAGKAVLGKAADKPGIDVLLLSRLLTSRQLESEDDFYFGALQRELAERGASSILLFVDHRAATDVGLASWIDPIRGVLPRMVAPSTEARIWAQCARARSALRTAFSQYSRGGRQTTSMFDAQLALLASQHAMREGTASNLRLHSCVAAACRALRPRIVITLHEGNASERMIWSAARTGGTRPLCVGYQHTRLLQRTHAIRRPVNASGIDCDPEVILTLGEIPQAMLAGSPELRSVQLITYGSHRRTAHREPPPTQERKRHCVVLPDAEQRECAILFEFAIACARRLPDITFSLRPHPILNLATLRSRHAILSDLPPNVCFSTGTSLDAECADASYCLYRGSSAVIHAVLAGVRPFYVSRPHELNFDTLFELQEWRETVTSPEDLVVKMSGAAVPEAARRAWSYCDRYVSTVRPDAIDELLEAT
jgi:hypothetical protein